MNYFFIIQLTVEDGSKFCSRKMLRLPQHSAAGDDDKTVFSGSSLVTLKKTSTTADRSVATGSKKNPDITHMEIFILLQWDHNCFLFWSMMRTKEKQMEFLKQKNKKLTVTHVT